MSLQYRRSKTVAPGTRLNVSKSGLSVSKRVGPLTLNSRGRGSLRIAPGLSYRFGRSGKNGGVEALIMLGIVAVIALVTVALIVLEWTIILLFWIGRWVYFGTQALVERRRERSAESSA
jgi:hypothetical protein